MRRGWRERKIGKNARVRAKSVMFKSGLRNKHEFSLARWEKRNRDYVRALNEKYTRRKG